MTRFPTIRCELIAAACLLLAGCSDTRKLDEAIVYRGPQLTLKLVHYHRNLPFHYVGDEYRVMCQSIATRSQPSQHTDEPGWRTLGYLPHDNQGRTASDYAERVLERYQIVEPGILVWPGVTLSATWDGCGHISRWDPSRLPPDLINEVDKPEYCQPAGQADCRYYDFQDDRRPKYAIESVDRTGRLAFTAESPSLPSIASVSTRNFGSIWHVTSRPPGTADSHVPIEAVRTVAAKDIDPEAAAVPLIDWFDAELPPQAGPMVVWSSGIVDCGAQNGRNPIDEPPECLEVSITNKWGDEAYLSLWYESSSLRWHFGQIQRGGRIHTIDRLTSVPRALSRASNGNQVAPTRQIATELELRPTSGHMDLSEVIDGKWETLCFIGPYTHNEQASEIAGFPLDVEGASDIVWSDRIVLLAAIAGGHRTRLFEVRRGNVDFVHRAGECYPRARSTFRVADDGHPYAEEE